MTHRSRNGGPPKTHRKNGPRNGQPKKLHHPPSSTSVLSRTSSSATDPPPPPQASQADSPTDQEILSLIRKALHSSLSSPDFTAKVQKIKSLLYDEQWLDVFTDPELLEAYAGRWVPSRALCYRDLLLRLNDVRRILVGQSGDERGSASVEDASQDDDSDNDDFDGSEARMSKLAIESPSSEADDSSSETARTRENQAETGNTTAINILALGGGAGSELLAIAAIQHSSSSKNSAGASDTDNEKRSMHFTAADIGSWSPVLNQFTATAKEEWRVPLETNYIECDLLSTPFTGSPLTGSTNQRASMEEPPISLASHLAQHPPHLITLLFTLTELLSQSPSHTITLLRDLTARIPSGSLFLVADSASDISEFTLGASERKYTTWTVCDMVMTRMLAGQWEARGGEDSRWFRLDPAVAAGWVVKLENTRYWYRLYRRI